MVPGKRKQNSKPTTEIKRSLHWQERKKKTRVNRPKTGEEGRREKDTPKGVTGGAYHNPRIIGGDHEYSAKILSLSWGFHDDPTFCSYQGGVHCEPNRGGQIDLFLRCRVGQTLRKFRVSTGFKRHLSC